MKKNIIITLLAAATLTSCGEYNKLLKSTDYEYKYEAAKNYFAKGQYNRSATLLNELITILKGTDKAEESLYMLGMSYYNQKDYQTAAQTFITYFNTYPRGTFTELARFHAGKALFLDTPEPRLDQSSTYQAIQQGTSSLSTNEDSTKGMYAVEFCGYFPTDNPKYSIIVSINKTGLPASGELMAGDVFKKIVGLLFPY